MKARVMFQGTSSGAGKSTMAAVLCRHLSLSGKKVAPFKALNISLNSYVTKEGKEIGMAQAFQAIASGIDPSADMNPLLLKPSGNGKMQLVLDGKPFMELKRGGKDVSRDLIMSHIADSFRRLEANYDYIVMEGSGSPVEINLKARDIANMRTAEMARSPVVLVGDIDRGGVFAGLYGTYHLLDPGDRRLLKGFIINRFRGEGGILRPGIDKLEARMGIPCLGVVPMVDARLPGEDSLSIKNGSGRKSGEGDVRRAWIEELDKVLRIARDHSELETLIQIMEDGSDSSP